MFQRTTIIALISTLTFACSGDPGDTNVTIINSIGGGDSSTEPVGGSTVLSGGSTGTTLSTLAGTSSTLGSDPSTTAGGSAQGTTVSTGGSTITSFGGSTLAVGGDSSQVTGGSSSVGSSATGGTSSVGGSSTTGGTSSVGGSSTTGGTSSVTGGSSSVGGSSAKGGTSSVGGSSVTGGTSSLGGSSAKGGTSSVGGSSIKGGSSSLGGSSAKGGTSSVGGSSAKGGTSSVGGSSATLTCTLPAANCNGSSADGCEVDLSSDLNNCGTCGTKCVTPANMVATCTGSCQYECLGGWSDCNNNLSDGCEVNLTSNVNNCLGCGLTCVTAPHTVQASCTVLGCEMGTCEAGWGDCNGIASDGCEIDLLNGEGSNCGSCGTECVGGGSCLSGSCEFPVDELTSIPGGGVIDIIEDTNNLYWTSQGSVPGVYKLPKSGGTPVKIASGTLPGGLVTDGTYVYWSEQQWPQKLQRTPVGGGTTNTLTTEAYPNSGSFISSNFARHLVLNGGYLYFIDQEYQNCPKTDIGSGDKSYLYRVVTNKVSTRESMGSNLGRVTSLSKQAFGESSILIAICGTQSKTTREWTNGSIQRFLGGTLAKSLTGITNLREPFAGFFWVGTMNGTTQTWYWDARVPADIDISAMAVANTDGTLKNIYLSSALNSGEILDISTTATYGTDATTLAIDQGVVTTMTSDKTSIYWVADNGTGNQFIRQAVR